MDFVLSAIDASPWGLSGYGFAEWAERSPTNSVVALTSYWIDRTRRLLAFEERFAERCLRLRYEDLVTRTDEVLAGVWKLIGVSPPAAPANAAFAAEHDPHGAADHKVWYTRAVHEDSLGRGARVPPQLVTGALRSSVNELAARLEYPLIDDFWGSGDVAPAQPPSDGGEATELVELRILEGQTLAWRGVIDLAAASGTKRSSEPGRTARIVVIERGALAAIRAGSENVGGALRARTVRSYGPWVHDFAGERQTFQRLAAFLADGGDGLLAPDGALGQLLA
jgi:hypothetical protein